MSTFKYLVALAHGINQRRYKQIEVFNEEDSSRSTKTYQLYQLALQPGITAEMACTNLFGPSEKASHSRLAFNRLLQRTITRLENLVLLTDPERYSNDPEYVQHVAAVRSIVTGLYLAQNSIDSGALFHLRKGLKYHAIIPSFWQGYCVAGLRYMVFYHTLHGPLRTASIYHEILLACVQAVQLETILHSQHDFLIASLQREGTLTHRSEQQWQQLVESCKSALREKRLPWFEQSIARITNTALQALGQYAELLQQQRNSPLPKREVLIASAIAYIALGNEQKASVCAFQARPLFAAGTVNWYICTNIAVRSHLLQADATRASTLLLEARSQKRMGVNSGLQEIKRKMLEAYCDSLQHVICKSPPRRGRPLQRTRDLLNEIRDTSTARHYHVALHIWLLVESIAQHKLEQYEETLLRLRRSIQRSKNLRSESRLVTFVEFLYQSMRNPPTQQDLRKYSKRLESLSLVYSENEIVRFEILGKLLVNSEQRVASSE
jgi:hypothetical protein